MGRLLHKSEGSQTTTYTWNENGLLAKVRLPDGNEWTYRYDAFGRRVEKNGPDHKIQFVWDGDVVLHEVRLNNDRALEVDTWEFDPYDYSPITKVEQGAQFLCLNDASGTPSELVTRDGEVAWEAVFTVFGELRAPYKSAVDCPVRFQGQWYDAESGLHYNRFRYYDPGTGRFLSPDPIGLFGGVNLYTYAANPVGLVDPLGLVGRCPPKGKKRGPKPWPKGPHNKMIAKRIRQIKAKHPEWRHVGGGPKTERVIKIRGGSKSVRRPDITFRRPDGSLYHENVGRVRADGKTPVPREVAALDDLQRATGTRPKFTPYWP
jgi:RHS repeat-associated protein